MKGIWWSGGQRWLDELQLAAAYTDRIESLRDLIAVHEREIDQVDARIHRRLRDDAGYRTIQRIAGVGPVFAAVFIAEIGDVHRFGDARRLCSWAGLTPRLRESDAHTHRGHITKQGSRLVRWAAIEAVSGPPANANWWRSKLVSAPVVAPTSAASPRHVISSRSSTTGDATARSVACNPPARREDRARPGAARLSARPTRCGRLSA